MTNIAGTEGNKRRLGRGLGGLFGAGSAPDSPAVSEVSAVEQEHQPSDEIALELIETNPYQPRKEFDEDALEELAASIRQHGVLQPLLVRQMGETYQLIAGERRWRAAQRAQLATVPCRVMDMDDRGACEAAIEENLKRRDLNVLEKAEAFREYLSHFNSTVEQLANHLSMNRSTVSNILRLLDLAEPVREALRNNLITGGHARAILALPDNKQIAMCQRIQDESMNVRQVEQAVREMMNPAVAAAAQEAEKENPRAGKPKLRPSNHVVSLQDQLRQKLGVKVEIALKTKDTGRVVLHFKSNEDFERVIRSLRDAA